MILMYHKVHLESPGIWWVTVDDFYRQMTELAGYRVVYLDDYDPNDPKQVVITFDGIYRNVLQYAAPILKKFGYPFELFLSSDFIGADNSFDKGEPLAAFTSSDELQRLCAAGGRLQWHTRSHPNLRTLEDRAQMLEELTIPEELLSLDETGFGWFAYPYGEFSPAVLEECRKRFRGAVSCNQGNDVDRYLLNRVTVTNQTSFKRASIGVIVPSYNYGHFLVEALESVLRQTRAADEILIADDCSTDNTLEIANRYRDRYPHLIRVQRNSENLGIIANFNRAALAANSDYLCFLGADNRFRSDYLERTAAVLDANPDTAIAYTDYALFGPRAQLEYSAAFEPWRGPVKQGEYYIIQFPDFNEETRQLLQTKNFIHGSSLFRKVAFLDVDGYREESTRPEDHALFRRIVNHGWKAWHVPQPLLEYRQHSFSQANSRYVSHRELQFYREEFTTLSSRLTSSQERAEVLQTQLEEQARQLTTTRQQLQAFEQGQRFWQKELEESKRSIQELRPLAERSAAAEQQLRSLQGEVQSRLGLLEQQQLRQAQGAAPSQLLSQNPIVRTSGALCMEHVSPALNLPHLKQSFRARARVVKRKFAVLRQQFLPSVADRDFLPYFLLAAQGASLLRTECRWKNAEGRAAEFPMVARPLGLKPLYFGIQCPADGLRAVEFLFGTYARRNTCSVTVEIQDWSEKGALQVLRRCRIRAEALADNAYFPFEFEPILPSKGMLLRIAINSSDAGPINQVALWGSDLTGTPLHQSPFTVDSMGRYVAAGYQIARAQELRLADVQGESKELFMPSMQLRYPQPTLQVFRHGWEPEGASRHWLPLFAKTKVIVSFRAAYDFLEGISFLFGTFGRENSCSIFLEIFEGSDTNSEVLRRATLSARALRDNQRAEFCFSPILDALGKEFTLIVSSPDSTAENCVALWGTILPIDSSVASTTAVLPGVKGLPPVHAEKLDFRLLGVEVGVAVSTAVPPTHAFVPLYRVQSSETGLLRREFGWNGGSLTREPFRLLPSGPLEFSFRPDVKLVDHIRIAIATYSRSNSCTLVFELRRLGAEGELETIVRREYSAKDFVDNDFHSFRFTAIQNADSELLFVRLSSPDASQENSVAVWGTRLDLRTSLAAKFVLPEYSQPSWVDLRESKVDPQYFLASKQTRYWLKTSPLLGSAVRHVLLLVPFSAEWPYEKYKALLTSLKQQGISVELFLEDELDSLYRVLLGADLVLCADLLFSDALAQLVRVCRRAGRLVGFVWSGAGAAPAATEELDSEQRALWGRCAERRALHQRLMRECDFALRTGVESATAPLLVETALYDLDKPDRLELPQAATIDPSAERSQPLAYALSAEALSQVARRCAALRLPHFTIISVLYGKEREVPFFLKSLRRQSYQGSYDLIFVDDRTPDNSVRAAREYHALWTEQAAESGEFVPELTILENEKNLGNCRSRNRALAVARGDVLVVIDADCLLNRDFLQSHADLYARGECDVVVGYMNLETGDQEPSDAVTSYENDWARVEAHSNLQDTIHHDSFLNCITRNFSIRRDFLEQNQQVELFDPMFSYSKDPASGFGWEDVEMGFRIFKAGARIKFADDTFSIHISHPPAVPDKDKPPRSLLNFRRLLDKHPEIICEARRWVIDTFQKICAWADGYGISLGENREHVDYLLRRFSRKYALPRAPKQLRVLSYRWHCAHQYELYKSGHRFSLVRFPIESFTNHWSYEQRPFPRNAGFKPLDAIDFRDYDVAILHFDENVLAPENSNGVLGSDWGYNFKWFMANVPLPKVAICHGTPQFYGQYDGSYAQSNLLQVIEPERQKMVDYLGDTLVIVNSFQAQREWRFRRSRVIWHGFDPSEFAVSRYEQGILRLGGALESRPHYRGLALYRSVVAKLAGEHAPTPLRVDEPGIEYSWGDNNYALQKFRNYINAVRRFSVYFNPTLRSPMPRSRAEAMLCGLVSVSANNHDVELFIKNGVNGFYSNDSAELAEYLTYLLTHPVALREMGARSRQLAADIFNHDRYLSAWSEVLAEVAS